MIADWQLRKLSSFFSFSIDTELAIDTHKHIYTYTLTSEITQKLDRTYNYLFYAKINSPDTCHVIVVFRPLSPFSARLGARNSTKLVLFALIRTLSVLVKSSFDFCALYLNDNYKMLASNGIQFVALLSLHLLIAVGAEVITDEPDLSRFKLRPVTVDADSQLETRSIDDLGQGAEQLYEAMFVRDQRVHCIAYAHLFKMIDTRRQAGPTSELRPITETSLLSLAIVAEVDRALYSEMFDLHTKENSAKLKLASLFREAIEQVEHRNGAGARDTWFDLMQCASAHFGDDLNEFLRDKKRLHKALDLLKLKSNSSGAPRQSPRTLDEWRAAATRAGWKPEAQDLRKKFDGDEPKWRPVSHDELNRARFVIDSSDDQNLGSVRREALNRLQVTDDDDDKPFFKYNGLENLILSEPENASPADTSKTQVSIEVDEPVMLIFNDQNRRKIINEHKTDTRLAIVEYVLMRANGIEKAKEAENMAMAEVVPRLKPLSAFNFVEHWIKLKKLDSLEQTDRASVEIYKKVKETVNSKHNIRLAAAIYRATKEYRRLIQLITSLQAKQKQNSFKSFKEYESEMNEALALLDSIGAFVDVDDIRRGFGAKARLDLQQYTTLNRFINGEIW